MPLHGDADAKRPPAIATHGLVQSGGLCAVTSTSASVGGRVGSLRTFDGDNFWPEWRLNREVLERAIERYHIEQEALIKYYFADCASPSPTPPVHVRQKHSGGGGLAPSRLPCSRSGSSLTLVSFENPESDTNCGTDVNMQGITSPPSEISMDGACTPTNASLFLASRQDTVGTSGDFEGSANLEAIPEEKFGKSRSGISGISISARSSASAKRSRSVSLVAAGLASKLSGRDKVPVWLRSTLDWWMELEEPERTGSLYYLSQHKFFQMGIGFVIFCNAIYTAYQANYEMDTLGPEPRSDKQVEPVFLGCYVMELIIKLSVHRLYYFCNKDMGWNLFDLGLVVFSACDWVLIWVSSTTGGSVTFARSLRLFKIGKILRIFRAMRFLKELRVMISSIVGSFSSLLWSFVMIGMILYIFALIFIQQMTLELSKAGIDDDYLWRQQRHYFRNVERTSLTLLEASLGGLDWDNVYAMIEPLGLVYQLAFIFYVAFFNFAVLNILTGIFVENALKLCKPTKAEQMEERRRLDEQDRKEYTELFKAMDLDGNGCIRRDDFIALTKDPTIKGHLRAIGLNTTPELLFEALSGGGVDSVKLKEGVERLCRQKGPASSIEVHGLLVRSARIQSGLEEFRAHMENLQLRTASLEATVTETRSQPSWRVTDGFQGNVQDAGDGKIAL